MTTIEKVNEYLDRALRYLNTPCEQRDPGEYAALMACKAEIWEEATKGGNNETVL